MLEVLGPYREIYVRARIHVTDARTLSIRQREFDAGRVTTTRFSFQKGRWMVWEDKPKSKGRR